MTKKLSRVKSPMCRLPSLKPVYWRWITHLHGVNVFSYDTISENGPRTNAQFSPPFHSTEIPHLFSWVKQLCSSFKWEGDNFSLGSFWGLESVSWFWEDWICNKIEHFGIVFHSTSESRCHLKKGGTQRRKCALLLFATNVPPKSA
jgi:hypothetical protein